jgi:hydrogenase expression/formation protein HypD
MTINLLENGRARVENQYSRTVKRRGNEAALKVIEKVFKVVDREWRGLGWIPDSGMDLNDDYLEYDARRRIGLRENKSNRATECISGQILRGNKKPFDCRFFGVRCTPENPMGATMVSSEGACAAYYRYKKSSLKVLKAEGADDVTR